MSVSWFERLLCRILPYRDISKVVDGAETLYLRRFFLRRCKKGSTTGDEGGIFLHVIHRSDDDRDPHDHPWDFTSVILSGGYWDEQWLWTEYDGRKSCGTHVLEGCYCHGDGSTEAGYREHLGNEWVGRTRVVRRAAEHLHRVQGIKDKPTWTLVFTGPKRREWGFVEDSSGWKHWREYLGLDLDVCICPSKLCEHRPRPDSL